MTKDRVQRLLADLSARSRTETASIVAAELASGSLTEAERRIALDIVGVLAQDAVEAVREALAEHLKSCPYLPRELALTMAHDVATVAVPILRFTQVLHDSDLIAVIHTGNVAKQIAIAGRDCIPEAICEALVATCDRGVVKTAVGNLGAILGEGAMQRVLQQFGHDPMIQRLLIDRPALPATIAQRLVECAADDLRARLMMRHRLPPALFEELMMHGRDRALSQMIASVPEDQTETLASSLAEREMLPALLLLRCLCDGSTAFVEAGFAVLARLPLDRTRILIYDQGPLGFQAIYRRAALPDVLLPAFRVTIATVRSLSGARAAESDRLILERLLDHYPGLQAADLEQALAQLWRVVIPDSGDRAAALP